tara:strand:+ start:12728 stop:13177 length:450 start_codon:yes stop_codon:yes gene_type:complete
MTTGFVYAAIFYVASLLLIVGSGYAFFQGDAGRLFKVLPSVVLYAVPLLFSLLGFVVGFFREKQKLLKKQAELNHQAEAISAAAASTPAPRVAPPTQNTLESGRPMSEEVREYLKETSSVDLKGIREFIEETRRHKLEDLPGGGEERQG